tara:strand:- start:20 stop:646 length:627 start_codon:yes stop_codon:yes gene_type:complete
MNLGLRVKNLRKDHGWSQQEFADKTILSRGRLAQLETDPNAEVKALALLSIAKAFGCSIEQLMSNNAIDSMAGMKLQPITRKAPVMEWRSLPDLLQGEFMLQSDCWVGCPHDLSENSFALTVQDEVMTSSNGRSYPQGVLVFVDPDQKAESGNRVIAIDTETLSSVFRELVISGGVQYLKPLNDRYPISEFTSSTKILGVVVGSYLAE